MLTAASANEGLLEQINNNNGQEAESSVPPGAITSYSVAYGVSERPCRLTESLNELESSGLAALCTAIRPTRATREQLLMAHTPEHVDATLGLCGVCQEEEGAKAELQTAILKRSMTQNFVYMNETSVDCALLAAGACS